MVIRRAPRARIVNVLIASSQIKTRPRGGRRGRSLSASFSAAAVEKKLSLKFFQSMSRAANSSRKPALTVQAYRLDKRDIIPEYAAKNCTRIVAINIRSLKRIRFLLISMYHYFWNSLVISSRYSGNTAKNATIRCMFVFPTKIAFAMKLRERPVKWFRSTTVLLLYEGQQPWQ